MTVSLPMRPSRSFLPSFSYFSNLCSYCSSSSSFFLFPSFYIAVAYRYIEFILSLGVSHILVKISCQNSCFACDRSLTHDDIPTFIQIDLPRFFVLALFTNAIFPPCFTVLCRIFPSSRTRRGRRFPSPSFSSFLLFLFFVVSFSASLPPRILFSRDRIHACLNDAY